MENLCIKTTYPKEEWTKYQLDNAHKVIRYDFRQEKDIRYIGGLDISFDKKDITSSEDLAIFVFKSIDEIFE